MSKMKLNQAFYTALDHGDTILAPSDVESGR